MKKVKYTVATGAKPIGEHTMHEPIPDQSWEQFDPFLLLHHHGPHTFEPYNQGLPFGPHPHRGFETLTLVYHGAIEHKDSTGASSVIDAGGIQWMTAARGIVHSENISEAMRHEGGKMEIVQLWMNLPAQLKMSSPKYYGLQKNEIPTEKNGVFTTQVISGKLGEFQGGVDSPTQLSIFNVSTSEGMGSKSFQLKPEETTLIYLLNGTIEIGGKVVLGPTLVQLTEEETNLEVKSLKPARFMIFAGKKINEPIVAQGPFVMNNTTQILQAMRDYQMGKMGVM